MPELRRDPTSGRWSVIAPHRALRPQPGRAGQGKCDQDANAESCPFCAGHEEQTPRESHALREMGTRPDTRGWRVRIVPNKYPIAAPDDQSAPGAHEVVIESPDHVTSMAALSPDQWCHVIWAWRDRLQHWKRDPRWAYGLIFKNAGLESGASLEHVHSQLIALPMVPTAIEEELRWARETVRAAECPLCKLATDELASPERVVLETPRLLAVCPVASRFPYETWLLPKRHAASFEDLERDFTDEIALAARAVTIRLEAIVGRAYNLLVHTAPFRLDPRLGHWRFAWTPRLTTLAGFEISTGMFINTVYPEDAAARLRAP